MGSYSANSPEYSLYLVIRRNEWPLEPWSQLPKNKAFSRLGAEYFVESLLNLTQPNAASEPVLVSVIFKHNFKPTNRPSARRPSLDVHPPNRYVRPDALHSFFTNSGECWFQSPSSHDYADFWWSCWRTTGWRIRIRNFFRPGRIAVSPQLISSRSRDIRFFLEASRKIFSLSPKTNASIFSPTSGGEEKMRAHGKGAFF